MNSFSYQTTIPESATYRMDKFSISGSLGYLGGESNEYVYDESGRTLSQLTWKINGAAIIKGEVNVDLLPWLSANANGWSTMDTNGAQMDDYDWMNPAQSKWTDWSHHPDTDLNDANAIDLNLRGWVLQNQHYKLGVTAGYQEDSFDFSARGGCYQYANGLYTGCFHSNETLIDYQQNFEATYLGLTGKYLMNAIEFNATVKFSPWVKASDVDEHYARNITFTERGNHSNFSSVTASAGYYMSQYTQLFLEAAYTQFANGKADTLLDDYSDGGRYYIADGAGLSNSNYALGFGIKYATA